MQEGKKSKKQKTKLLNLINMWTQRNCGDPVWSVPSCELVRSRCFSPISGFLFDYKWWSYPEEVLCRPTLVCKFIWKFSKLVSICFWFWQNQTELSSFYILHPAQIQPAPWRRRRQQKMRWLDGITDSMDIEFEQTLGDGEGQGSLACCSPWGCRVTRTRPSNWTTTINLQQTCLQLATVWMSQIAIPLLLSNKLFLRPTF